MNKKFIAGIFACLLIFAVLISAGCVTPENGNTGKAITITDDLGRIVEIPTDVKTIALSGSGSARYIVYLQSEDKIIGVDTTDESTDGNSESRPYMLAHPEIADNPVLGPNKATISAETALKLNPDVIFFSTEGDAGINAANEATEKTGIPVVCYNQYDPAEDFDRFSANIRLLGKVLGKEQRAEDVVKYFSDMRSDLISRTPDIPMEDKPVVYVGGCANRGSHGMISTKPEFIGFTLLSANHKAADIGDTESANIAKEKILEWDPDIIFVDLATLTAAGGGALVELKTDASYQGMTAVKNGEIYTVMPDTYCKTNHGTSFANAYYVGTVLYPEQFKDINPAKKAGEIYKFLVGKDVYSEMYNNTGSLAYQKIDLSVI